MITELTHNGGLHGEDKDFENQKCDTNEDETEDLTTSKGNLEALNLVVTAKVSNFDIADGGDSHADVTSEHGSAGTDKEANGGVGELGVLEVVSPGLVDGADKDTGEENAEEGEHAVLLDKESFGTLNEYNVVINKDFFILIRFNNRNTLTCKEFKSVRAAELG
jgi:hypothetical protein